MKTKNIPPDIKSKSINEAKIEILDILKRLEDNGIDVDIIEYLKESPNKKTLLQIINLLDIKPRDLMRKGETVYKEKHLNRENLTDDDLVQFMVDNPILIERPIVYDDKRAIIGRPPENVLIFLK